MICLSVKLVIFHFRFKGSNFANSLSLLIIRFVYFRILLFEEKAKAEERPTGVAPKRDLSSLP